jgi:UDP-3-O-[3-hydroxymyristoyl] glucosamine N-acyltransferase
LALVTPRPQAAFALAANLLVKPRLHDHTSAIHPDAELEEGVILSPGVVVGPGAQIGSGTVIGANTSIGPGVAIGRNCQISANVTIGFALIGDGVRVLAGARIGEAGFGVAGAATGAIDVPQLVNSSTMYQSPKIFYLFYKLSRISCHCHPAYL